MKPDMLLAGVLFLLVSYYLYQRNLSHMIAWIVITYLVAVEVARLSCVVSMLVSVVVLYLSLIHI